MVTCERPRRARSSPSSGRHRRSRGDRVGRCCPRRVAQDAKAILMLHTYGHDAPGRIRLRHGVRARAARGRRCQGRPVRRDARPQPLCRTRRRRSRRATYLRARYADKQLAVVAAAYDRAAGVRARSPRYPLFPGVPVAALLTRHPSTDRASMSRSPGRAARSAIRGAGAEAAAADAPDRARSSGAAGTGGEARLCRGAGRRSSRRAAHVPIISLRNLPLDELLPRVRRCRRRQSSSWCGR